MIRLYTPTSGHGGRLVEWLFAGLMMSYGAYLILPLDTFAGAEYRLLAEIAPETVWGALALAVGMLRATALLINGHWRRTPALRVAGSIGGVMWWIGIFYLLISGPEHHVPAGIVFYPVFTGFEAISCWRGAVDAFHSGAFRRRRGAARPCP